MKKILSIVITLTLLLSALSISAIPASAAEGGDWAVIKTAAELQPDYSDAPGSYSGYEYTDDGFHTIPTTGWANTAPHVSIQTKEKYDLKKGIYLQIRIDDFTYLSDKWFNFHVWDSVGINPGSTDPKFGSGVQTLVRPSDGSINNDINLPGEVSTVEWYYDEFTRSLDESSTMVDDQNLTTNDGKPILTLVITWDGFEYNMTINGAKACDDILYYMNDKWGGNDSEAYIGFNFQNANKGGTAECTILKFGTSEEDAKTPAGTDRVEPIDNTVEYAPIADPSTVAENMPAILMTGDPDNSDVRNTPASAAGATSSINADGSIHVVATEYLGVIAVSAFNVDEDVSYNIADFPYVVALTRNYCSCGIGNSECLLNESVNCYIPCGDQLAPAAASWIEAIPAHSVAYKAADGANYTIFGVNALERMGELPEGRINMVRFDTPSVSLDEETSTDEFDVMFVAFFRSEAEALAYMENYASENSLTKYEAEESDETLPPLVAPVTTAPNGTTPDGSAEAPSNTGIGDSDGPNTTLIVIIAVVAVVVIAAVVVIVVMKKKKK